MVILNCYFTLSSVLIQSFDFSGSNVNINENISNIKASTIKTITDSVVFIAISSYNPPNQITINSRGMIYLTSANHHFPILNVLLLELKKLKL